MESFSATSDGFLLAANGIDPVLVWDGISAQFQEAGLAAPTTAVTIAGNTFGTITGTYFAYVRFVDENNNPSDLSPLAGPVIFSNILNVVYSNVPVPSTSKAKRRQILRNTAGQTSVFYVDVDTADLTTTTFTSTRTDTNLQAQEAIALFDSLGMPLANTYGVPPSDKSAVSVHLDRAFLAGEETYKDGSVKVTFGSKTVEGIGTQWPSTLRGRFLWVSGADRYYEIDAVDVVNQTITLLEAYQTASIPYASYGIRPPLAQRRLVQFSQAGQPQSWPVTNALSIQEDGDDVVGLMPMGSFVYILERRHIYKLTFQEDPIDDGFVFLACNRGCINHRCFAVVDESAYLLDDAGIYMFSGTRTTEQLSGPIQDLFEQFQPGQQYRIRWASARYFHCVYDFGSQVIRWFVCLTGERYPRHAIAMNRDNNAMWIEEYPVPIAGSCTGLLEGQRRVFLGGPNGQVYIVGTTTLDVVSQFRGTVRGIVSSATPLSLTANAATFGDDVVNSPITIVTGEGKLQQRVIVERVSGTTVRVDRPWSIYPDAGDTFQIGGVKWIYRTGWFRWAPMEEEGQRRIEVLYEPTIGEQHFDAYLYQDRSGNPVVWDSTYAADELSEMGTTRGDSAIRGDLTGTLGFMQRRMDDHKEFYIDGRRLLSWQMEGVTNTEFAIIYEITLDGAYGGAEGRR